MRGTEQAVLAGVANPGCRIAYPAPGTVIALDPDIPLEDQRLFFEAQPKDRECRWVLDGRSIGAAGTLLLWTPVRGKHALMLVDAAERTLDSVTFEVRGILR